MGFDNNSLQPKRFASQAWLDCLLPTLFLAFF